jgi:putative hydrolase of the HAD superfamily
MTLSVRVIGFDLDNTLYDQGQHMRSFFRAAAEDLASRHSVPRSEIEAAFLDVWQHRTSYYPRLFDEALERLSLHDTQTVKALVSLYHGHRAELTLFAGVRDMLARLRGRFSLFIITDGNEQMQRGKLESLGLAGAVDDIVMTGSFGKEWSKPAVHAYVRMLERFGGEPSDYLYVGDNPACDFHGARQLGMRTARVMTEPFGTHAAPSESHEAEISIPTTLDLEKMLV